jgi:hypothetical protein
MFSKIKDLSKTLPNTISINRLSSVFTGKKGRHIALTAYPFLISSLQTWLPNIPLAPVIKTLSIIVE